MIYKLSSDKRELFQRILINLEKRANALGISYIQMSGSELSEIYMVLGQNESSNPVYPELFNYGKKICMCVVYSRLCYIFLKGEFD